MLPPLMGGPDSYYTMLRFLALKNGILFAESERTIAEVREKALNEDGVQKIARLKNEFLPFARTYSAKRDVKRNDELALYHFHCDEPGRETVTFDCRIMKLLHDSFPNNTKLGLEEATKLGNTLGIDEVDIVLSLRRIYSLYTLGVPKSLKPYIEGPRTFRVYSKAYFFNLD